jgi:hypothetical protein
MISPKFVLRSVAFLALAAGLAACGGPKGPTAEEILGGWVRHRLDSIIVHSPLDKPDADPIVELPGLAVPPGNDQVAQVVLNLEEKESGALLFIGHDGSVVQYQPLRWVLANDSLYLHIDGKLDRVLSLRLQKAKDGQLDSLHYRGYMDNDFDGNLDDLIVGVDYRY